MQAFTELQAQLPQSEYKCWGSLFNRKNIIVPSCLTVSILILPFQPTSEPLSFSGDPRGYVLSVFPDGGTHVVQTNNTTAD